MRTSAPHSLALPALAGMSRRGPLKGSKLGHRAVGRYAPWLSSLPLTGNLKMPGRAVLNSAQASE